jgi:predicted AAA+ superfamily ATPase
VESAVGAHLCNNADANVKIQYWREGSLEVDFVVSNGRQIVVLEVKSGKAAGALPGLKEFSRRNRRCRALVVGGEELPVGEFLRYPISHWFEQ